MKLNYKNEINLLHFDTVLLRKYPIPFQIHVQLNQLKKKTELIELVSSIHNKPIHPQISRGVHSFGVDSEFSDAKSSQLLDKIVDDYHDLPGLVDAVRADSSINAMAQKVFRDHYEKSQFEISQKDQQYQKFNNYVILGDFNFTLSVLQSFGHLIQNLRTNYDHFSALQSAEINNYINQYCAESLEHIEFTNCHGDELAQLQGPFPKVESVQFQFGYLKTAAIPFDAIFPAVRRMETGSMLFSDLNCFKHNFPHLKHFYFGVFLVQRLSDIETIMELNPQLTSISMFED